MSLHPRTDYWIPEETQRVARAAFPKRALGLRIADALGPIYGDQQFAELFPRRGQPAESTGRLIHNTASTNHWLSLAVIPRSLDLPGR